MENDFIFMFIYINDILQVNKDMIVNVNWKDYYYSGGIIVIIFLYLFYQFFCKSMYYFYSQGKNKVK